MKRGLQTRAYRRHVDLIVYAIQHLTVIRTFAHVSRRLKARHRSVTASALRAMTVPQAKLVLTTSARTHVPDLVELIHNVLFVYTAQCVLVKMVTPVIHLQRAT